MTSPELHSSPSGQPSSTAGVGVTIVIPVHNKWTITRQCLETLLAESPGDLDREILVVDDGSRDKTPELLAGFSNQVRVIRNEQALGFAGACNAGVAAAAHDLVVLLNNDTIPTPGWLTTLVTYALDHPQAAVVGTKLLFPNETIQHAGVVFGLDCEPHHIYAGFPADHPATTRSRRFQVVTAACALFRRQVWNALGGLDTTYRNGWEDVDYCMRAGQAGHEIHYCAESIVYHFESATRDLLSAVERENRALFNRRWREKVIPDDIGYYWMDGLLEASYGARYPIKLSVSPLLGGLKVGEEDRLADRILYDRARQVMILMRNNIVLNVRVQEAEARAAEAEQRLTELRGQLAAAQAALHDARAAIPASAPPAPDAPPPATTAQADEPAPPPAKLPHRIVGMVESPGRLPDVITDGVLVVSGWTLTESGQARIEVIVNGEVRGTVEYGEPREDAAQLYPGFPAGANCGFSGEIPVGDLPDGFHDVTIRIWATDVDSAEIATTFEIDNHAFETGRVIGRIDQPVRGAIFIPRELATVTGWVMAPSGIRSLETLVDGEPRGRVDAGALRPDIARRRRQYPNADHCGFSGSVPMEDLEPGSHDLTVLATANDGKQLALSTRIEIDGTYTIDGGVPILNRHYAEWLEMRAVRGDTPGIGSEIDLCIEALVPIAAAEPKLLEALVASVQAQVHQEWSLTLVDSSEASDAARELARDLASDDNRIHLVGDASAAKIAEMNAALAASSAAWVTILTPGVVLAPTAFSEIAAQLADAPKAVMLYTDEDRRDPESEVRWNPFFKPDWSPDLLLAMNYLGPLTLFRRETAIKAGRLREEFVGAEVFDLALRVSEGGGDVVHVADVLVTTLADAPAGDTPWHHAEWREVDRGAIADALRRRDVDATVELGLHPGTWRVRYAIPDPPGVTAVIPTGGKLQLLRPCLDDLLHRTDYPNFEILLVDNSPGDDVRRLVEELSLEHPNLRRIVDDRKPFNYSALINSAIPHVTTPLVLMLNDDITVIDPGWLSAMVEHAQRPEVGIVGAKLIFPDDTIQHAGVILGPFGGSVHVFKRLSSTNPGYFDLPDVVRNVSAVTFACALIDREVFDRIGGLDAERLPVAFNDTDFCLRAREAGFEVLYTPHAALYHHESVTKTVIAHPNEIGYLRERWADVIAHDPYYNPNLTRKGEDARLNMEPVRVA